MELALTDSNILLRLAQTAHPESAATATGIARLLRQDIDLCVVPQNLIEFWAVPTRPTANGGMGLKLDTVDAEMRRLRSLFHLLEGGTGIADSWAKAGTTASGKWEAGARRASGGGHAGLWGKTNPDFQRRRF